MSAPCPTCKPQENLCGSRATCDERGELISNSCVCFYAQRPANIDDGYRLFVQEANEYIVIVAEGVACDAACDNREPGNLCAEVPDAPGQCTGGPTSTMETSSASGSTSIPSPTSSAVPSTESSPGSTSFLPTSEQSSPTSGGGGQTAGPLTVTDTSTKTSDFVTTRAFTTTQSLPDDTTTRSGARTITSPTTTLTETLTTTIPPASLSTVPPYIAPTNIITSTHSLHSSELSFTTSGGKAIPVTQPTSSLSSGLLTHSSDTNQSSSPISDTQVTRTRNFDGEYKHETGSSNHSTPTPSACSNCIATSTGFATVVLGDKKVASRLYTDSLNNLEKICTGGPSCLNAVHGAAAPVAPDANNANEDVGAADLPPGGFPGDKVVKTLGLLNHYAHTIELPGTSLVTPAAPAITVSIAASFSTTWLMGLTLWAMVRPVLRR